MIGALLVVFREILEAALVVGIVAAAVKGLPHRGRLVAIGIGLGVAGAVGVALGIDTISQLAQGTGQQLFQAGVLGAAGLMLTAHNIWMAEHGRAMAARFRTLGADVTAGRASVAMLVAVTGLAVMREGSEIALFLYGIAASGTAAMPLLLGGLAGLASGIAVGVALFTGLSRIPLQRLFSISGLIILFMAAGMLAHAVQFLVQAGYLPALVARVWDSSAIVAGGSLVGRSLGALIGYTPAPSLMQMLAWIVSLAAIGGLMFARSHGSAPAPTNGATRVPGSAS